MTTALDQSPRERPLLMSGAMVRAILEDRKTHTRRVIRLLRGNHAPGCCQVKQMNDGRWLQYGGAGVWVPFPTCPYGVPGDRLWVRETFVLETSMEYERSEPTDRPFRWTAPREDGGALEVPHYRATEPEPHIVPADSDMEDDRTIWRPSIFMPRWASRITLEVTAVRVERLQEISPADVAAEGIRRGSDGSWLAPLGGVADFPYAHASEAFAALWDSIHARDRAAAIRGEAHPWEANPWVWVIEFRRIAAEKARVA